MMVRNPTENHLKRCFLSLAVFIGKSLDKNQAGVFPTQASMSCLAQATQLPSWYQDIPVPGPLATYDL